MKLLITGAEGQLGSELRRQILDRKSPIGEIPSVFHRADVVAADLFDFDISDCGAARDFIGAAKPDVIINCAAFTDVDACEGDPETAFRINAAAPGYVARAARDAGARMIHVSTDYVFSGDGVTPQSESDRTGPNTVYGKSKLAGETAVFAETPGAAVVRTAWLYGATGKNFVKTILGAAEKYGSVRVVDDQFGNPTSAADLAHHILKLAASGDSGLFHCTNHGVCSWYDFAEYVVGLSGTGAAVFRCTTAEYPSKTPRPAYSALCNRRLGETVGDEMRHWREAAADYMEGWARMNINKERL